MITNLCRVGLLAAALAAIVIVRAIADGPADAAKPPAAAPANSPPKVLITISKETTRITGPLRKDGYVDYLAAENEIASKGVTPENNAAMPFWKAVGPGEIEKANRERFFKMLGIPPLPETGDYFVPVEKFVLKQTNSKAVRGTPQFAKEYDAASKLLESGMARPWTTKEFPALAAWLAANKKPLSLIVEASKRPRRYDPLTGGGKVGLVAVPLPWLEQSRAAMYALTARAMQRAGEGKIDEAWDDLLACHRLARLTGQGPTLVNALVADAFNAIACGGDQILLQQVKLSASSATGMLGDLDKLSALPKMADRIDGAERFMFFDGVERVAQEGIDGLMNDVRRITGVDETKSLPPRPTDRAHLARIDWDMILRTGNSWYDRSVAAYRKPSHAERIRAFDKIKADVTVLAEQAKQEMLSIPVLYDAPPKVASRCLSATLIGLFLPDCAPVDNSEDRTAMRLEVTKLGFALAAYRADHGSYPAKLAELTPKYIAAVPSDIFNGEPLHYRQDGDGYLLYSVGVNGIDDDGKGADDCKNGEKWDDLALRVPESANRTP